MRQTVIARGRSPRSNLPAVLLGIAVLAGGTFLGRVTFPPRTTLMEADGNLVWALGREENDLPAVLRFRIDPVLP